MAQRHLTCTSHNILQHVPTIANLCYCHRMISIHQLHTLLTVTHDLAELEQPLQGVWLAPSFCEELCEQDRAVDSICSASSHFIFFPFNCTAHFSPKMALNVLYEGPYHELIH